MIRRPIGVGDREIKIRSIAIESSSKSVRFYEEILKGEKRSIPSSEGPPLVPSAGAKTKEDERLVGRKDFALKKSMLASLVSWMQIMEGFASIKALRTMVHLSESPRPRTFQDTI